MNSGTRVKLLICLVSDFGSFDYLCSFDSRTLPQRRPSMTDTRFIPNRVSVIDGRRCGSVRLANVHKLGAEIRYLTNLRNLRELFRYPSPENPGGKQSRTKISVGSFSK